MFSQNEWLLSKLCCFCRKRLFGETEKSMTPIKNLKQRKQMQKEKQMPAQSPNMEQQQQEPTKSSKSKPCK